MTLPLRPPPAPNDPGRRGLAHLPQASRLAFAADLALLRDTLAFTRDVHARCGPVSTTMLAGRHQVLLLGAEANECVLADRERLFSAQQGWQPLLGELFPRGLMLRDGDDHRLQRRLMLPAFRRDALELYLARMAPRIDAAVHGWVAAREFAFFPAIKRLTLALALDVFLGAGGDDAAGAAELGAVDHDFGTLVEASTAIVRIPLVGRKYARGLAARRRLAAWLHRQVARRRAAPAADLLSQLCGARDDEGRAFSDDDVVDHLIFLLMAAHDTTTSALSTMVWAFSGGVAGSAGTGDDDWQARLRAEAAALGDAPDSSAGLGTMELAGCVMREALRLHPPVPMLTRRAQRAFTLHGHAVPAGALVSVFPLFAQREARWWDAPDHFDPLRFGAERAEHRRHAYAWTPFGGGAHMCLGLHFAELQVRSVVRAMLRQADWALASPAGERFAFAPIAHPRGGLRVRATAR